MWIYPDFYNSCKNRYCPKCQGHKRDEWIHKRESELLKVPYYHIVFTLPNEFNRYALFKPKLIYGSLFKVAWSVIKDFAANPKFMGANTGMISILHTWKQDLDCHPHLHCIIPSGGITVNNKWKSSPTKGDYLFNTEALALTFKGKFLWYLKKYFKDEELQFWDLKEQTQRQYFYQLKESLYAKNWVVYSKKSFRDEQSVFEYLGRYTHSPRWI